MSGPRLPGTSKKIKSKKKTKFEQKLDNLEQLVASLSGHGNHSEKLRSHRSNGESAFIK
jgi:hypothetical protein